MMRSNWLDLRTCVSGFLGFTALGIWYGMAGGDDRITGLLFLTAFAIVIIGVLWNTSFFAAGTSARRKKRWEEEGRCAECGYDLRENQSGVCPECGTKIWS